MDAQVVGAFIGVAGATMVNIVGWVIIAIRQSNDSAKQDGAFEERVKGLVDSMGEVKTEMGGVKDGIGTCHTSISNLSVKMAGLSGRVTGLSKRVISLEKVVINGSKPKGGA
jgi:hypothetical protein